MSRLYRFEVLREEESDVASCSLTVPSEYVHTLEVVALEYELIITKTRGYIAMRKSRVSVELRHDTVICELVTFP